MSGTVPPRNWTETLGNAIFFDGLDSVEYLNWLSDRTVTAIPLVASFLHEFTHHWCFNSLVGNALAFTELRVNAISGRFPEYRPLCARDHLAVTCLSGLLRPIAEGMALFAEFDLQPSEMGVKVGTPLTAANLCFAQGIDDLSSRVMLNHFRRESQHIDRKASIYLNDFEIQEGYLPGYMLMKSLFGAMRLKAPDVTPELFLAYIRCFFWEDPGFVSLLATDEPHGPTVATNLLHRFLRRIDVLRLSDDLPDRLADFWEAWSAHGRFRPGRGIYVEPKEEAEATSNIQALIDAAADVLRTATPARDCKNQCSIEDVLQLGYDLANLRTFTIVARAPLSIEVEGDGLVFVLPGSGRAAKRFRWPCVGAPPDGDCECLAVIPNFAAYMVLILRSSQEVRVLGAIGPFDQTSMGAEVESFVVTIDRAMTCTEALRRDFEAVGHAAIDSPTLRDILEALDKHILSIYLALVTRRGRIDPATVEAETSLLRDSGLRPLFGSDSLGLRTVAALSLVEPSFETIHRFSREAQVSLAHAFWLPDEEVSEMARALEGVTIRDKTRLVIAADADRLQVLV